MDIANFNLLLAIIVTLSSTAIVSTQPDGTCSACNCQFNNAQVLEQIIEAKIATARANESGEVIVVTVNSTYYIWCLFHCVITLQGVSGVTYTRWGKSSCPTDTGAQLVYAGRAGGTWFLSQGGGAEKVCLPEDPVYLDGTTGFTISSVLYGAEYQFNPGPNVNVQDYNVPCAVCYVSTRGASIMVPA